MIDRRISGSSLLKELSRLDRMRRLRQFVGGTFLESPESLNLSHESQHL
jgi:hypothetical protein